MRVIGLTGGIGAGKSVVARILRCRNFPVYDCDFEARRLMESSEQLKRDIGEELGQACLTDGCSLNRPEIASIVFADPEKLRWLNGRVHGLVREDILSKKEEAERRGENFFFVESAILHTSGLDALCDEIWLVEASEQIRLQRAAMRDNCDADKIKSRMDAQREEFDKIEELRSNPKNFKIFPILNDHKTPLLKQMETLLKHQPD